MIRVKNWALIISCYVLTLFFIHTTSTCIVRLGDICNTLRYSNQYLKLFFPFFQSKDLPTFKDNDFIKDEATIYLGKDAKEKHMLTITKDAEVSYRTSMLWEM